MKQIQLPKGFSISLFAAEPMLANPVSFCIDERNRFYVAETFRIHHGVEDNRDHMNWLDDDLASRTVEDRVALYRKHLGEKVGTYGIEQERIRLIEDSAGKGQADRATVFADGFQQIPDGIAAGLLARGNRLWYACIPNLWLLTDSKGQGKADQRKLLHHGYGVHVSFYGHDLHGLTFGPDGKLYFSVGDRGATIQTAGKTLAYPDTGSVFRCNSDGSELEVFATGLRNPQELAFDKYGNLFTGDNNADHGDQARWVYVVDGGDSGWRIGYQYLNWPVDLGPWNAELLWKPHWDGQAAYILPPIANVADGPSGLAYDPGLGLPDRYRDHFFLCDFRGTAGISGIRSFAVKPKGASFELTDSQKFVWSVLATDVDFGMDGSMYILDWVDGWVGTGKGRIYKVTNNDKSNGPALAEVKKLMAEGVANRSPKELVKLLEHPHMRIRQEAQFALAADGAASIPEFLDVAVHSRNQLARLHALWGLAQIGRQHPTAYPPPYGPIVPFLADPDVEIRCQAAKLVGAGRVQTAFKGLIRLTHDPEPRVRFFATMALGKLGRKEAVPAILEMLRTNADHDPYLRHAGVMALTWIGDRQELAAASHDASRAVRMAVLLTWRRLLAPDVVQYLHDPDPGIVLEAARAIYDAPVETELLQLAGLAGRTKLSQPLGFRVLNANFRLGGALCARRIAEIAAGSDQLEVLRVEALRELAEWATPSGRDRVTGLLRPIASRSAADASQALKSALAAILQGPDRVRQEAARAAAALNVLEAGPILFEVFSDRHRADKVRLSMFTALARLHDPRLKEATELALQDAQPLIRAEARRVLAELDPRRAITELSGCLEKGTVQERQGALATLGRMGGAPVDAILCQWLDRLIANQVPIEVQLDLLEAAGSRTSSDVKKRLAAYESGRARDGPLAAYREALAGGNAERGRDIFYHKDEVSCLRCHKIRGVGGEVGPDLTGIGAREKRDYLLESIVEPNRKIAKGFETVVLALANGTIVSGIVKSEDAREVRLMTAEGNHLAIPRKQIEERSQGKSAMPEDTIKHLSKSELRDLVEFLAGLKQQRPAPDVQ
jgi:quinoprotein glucose dehydrogenase